MFHRLFAPFPAAVSDVVLLVVRVGLGIVLVAHGWQKVHTNGLEATRAGFDGMGVPLADVAAPLTAGIELVGGGLLVLGLLTPVVGVLVALVMLGAYWFAHRGAGLYAAEGGWELVGVIGLLALALAAVGPGRLALDTAVGSRRTPAREHASSTV